MVTSQLADNTEMGGTSTTTRILHVDDVDFADTTARLLQREDERITVETATTADEALEYIEAHDVDCVVSDYEMPGRNGIEFLEAVREADPELPFILLPGRGAKKSPARPSRVA